MKIFDKIWYDLVWFDIIWYDLVWFGMIWYDSIWFDSIRSTSISGKYEKPDWLKEGRKDMMASREARPPPKNFPVPVQQELCAIYKTLSI